MNTKFLSIIALCILVLAGGIAWLNRQKDGSSNSPQPGMEKTHTRSSVRDGSIPSSENPYSETREQREARESSAVIERNRMTAMWVNNASVAFEKTSDFLVTDLNLSAEQSEQVNAIFASRQQELARLLGLMTSGNAADQNEIFKQITALIRNKGLRADIEGVLSAEQLKAFDASEAKRERETVEARAYRDLAQINEVVRLTDNQKQQVLGVLSKQAAVRVEQEADSRAFMSLMYGGMADDFDSSHVRGLANMVNVDPTHVPNFEYGDAEHQQWLLEKKAECIENELSPLKNVLNENQLARYREHLEEQIAR